MDLTVDQQQPGFKYFCKICKKGFESGRALGGHMRSHGIGDETGRADEDNPASDWEDKNVPPNSKRMYSLRTNPNRLKSCRVCENCGKEFSSWKSFLNHDGKCGSEDAESLISSPESDEEEEEDRATGNRDCGRWSKKKRSLRMKVDDFNSPSREEEDLANCLMMLSNAKVYPLNVEPEESCTSASKEEERHSVNFMDSIPYGVPVDNKAKGTAKGLFECKACKKVFNSHQALGGHRASHKKVKGCFASRLDQIGDGLADEGVINQDEFFSSHAQIGSSSKRKAKVHECSICHRIFSSGQALGGHKRCHWITSNPPDASSLARFHQFSNLMQPFQLRREVNNSDQSLELKLDLNLANPEEDLRESNNQAEFKVSPKIYLQSWIEADVIGDRDSKGDNKKRKTNKNDNGNDSMQTPDEGADINVKLAKLSNLKDMSISGGSSSWLQVGIGTTTIDTGTDH